MKNYAIYTTLLIIFQTSLFSQDNFDIYFQQKQVEFEKGRIISNNLIVKNKSSNETTFKLHLLAPKKWKIIGSNFRFITILANDSTIIPLRYFPTSTKSSTNYILQVFISSKFNSFNKETRFLAKTKKKRIKNIKIESAQVIYLKNNQDIGSYSINVENRSGEEEMLYSSTNFHKLISTDTLNNNSNYSLNEFQDTIIRGNVKLKSFDGFKRRDEDDLYLTNIYAKRGGLSYSIFDENNKLIDKKNLQFISLPNTYINETGGNTMPMLIDARWNSYLDTYSSLNVNIRGNKLFENDHRLAYAWNTIFTSNNYSSTPYKYSSGHISYYTPRWYAQAGNIGNSSFGVNIGGWGARGGYFITKNNHQLQFYYIQSPHWSSSATRKQTGIEYSAKIKYLDEIKIGYFYRQDLYFNSNFHGANAGIKLPISNKHKTNISISFTQNTSSKKVGYFGILGYSGLVLNDNLGIGINIMYRDRYYAEANQSSLRIHSRFSYKLNDKSQFLLTSNYSSQIRYYYSLSPYKYNTYTSNLDYRNNYFKTNFTPGIFFKKYIHPENNFNQYGLRIRLNDYYPDKHIRYAITFQSGYNKSYSPIIDNPYFFFQMFGLVRYKKISINTMYSLGNINNIRYNEYTKIGIPQSFRISISNQYSFTNRHFLLNMNTYYKHEVHFKTHSLGIQPQFYYYTNSRWRFGIEMMYNFRSRADIATLDYIDIEDNYNNNMDFTFGINVRKQIDIPLPWMKEKFEDLVVESFYDINGNRKKDSDEKTIANLVIKLDDYEAISDENGKAYFKNIKTGNYKLKTIALELNKGWYNENNIETTVAGNYLAIPYLKGKSIKGNIILEKERYSNTKNEDYANIIITATDDNGRIYETISEYDGSFELYLPTGKYLLNMDESIFSEKYKLINNNPTIEIGKESRSINYVFIISEKQRKINVKKF